MMRNEILVVWLRRRAFACAGLSLIVAGSAHAQLSAPTGTVYTQHGIYSWAGASANPIFNIPGNGFMLSPGSGYPIVTGNTPISTFATPFVVGPVADWITTPNPLFPTFGGARTTIGGFSTGNAAGLVWSNYLVGDRTPANVQGGSYNISGGDITGVVDRWGGQVAWAWCSRFGWLLEKAGATARWAQCSRSRSITSSTSCCCPEALPRAPVAGVLELWVASHGEARRAHRD
jgi:hypothetical protein